MCGSTSMALSSFILAKIASLPLMLLYVYIGAAAGTLIADAEASRSSDTDGSRPTRTKKMHNHEQKSPEQDFKRLNH